MIIFSLRYHIHPGDIRSFYHPSFVSPHLDIFLFEKARLHGMDISDMGGTYVEEDTDQTVSSEAYKQK